MIRTLRRILDAMVPPRLRSAPIDVRRRAELSTIVIWIPAAVAAVFAIVQIAVGSREAGLVLAPACTAAALLPLWVRRTGSLALAGHGASVIATLGMGGLVALTGGIRSPYITGLVAAPMMAAAISGRRAGMAWLAVVLVVVWAMAALSAMDALPPPAPGSVTLFFVTLGVTSICVGISGMAIAHEALRVGAIRELERSERERELAASESMLLRADRLASVGMLATGVAHEINNPLTYVLTNVSAVQRRLAASDDPELQEAAFRLEMAREGARRVRDIVRDLNTFSRDPGLEQEMVSLREIVEWSLRMASGELRRKATVTTSLQDTPRITASSGRLSQVVVNLLVNAAQAIDDGAPDANTIEVVLETDARGWAILSVRDTGRGISPEDLARVTDPFFTTKPIGEGIGLGLAVSRNIVEQLGGTITFASELGRGTRVEVALPPDASEARDQGSKR